MKEEIQPYSVTIDDGISKYQYIFNLKGEISIFDIANTISERYSVKLPEGVYINKEVDMFF
jgi:hypothetical protein